MASTATASNPTADPELVEVEVTPKGNGIVIGKFPRPAGETVTIPAELADELRGGGSVFVRVRPLLRSRRDNLVIGSRITMAGEEVYAPSMAKALELHRAGAADIVNGPELGESFQLPVRDTELEAARRAGLRRLRIKGDVAAPTGPGWRAGDIVELPGTADDLILRNLAVGIDWPI